MIILADLNQGRPWWRERVPGLKTAISIEKSSVDLVDVFGALGELQLTGLKLYQRRAFFLDRAEMLAVQQRLLAYFEANQYSHVLFTTMDICLDFLDKDFLITLREKGIAVGGILGDDEFNHSNFRSIVYFFDFLVVYLEKAARFYKKYSDAEIFVQNNCYSSGNTRPLKPFLKKSVDLTLVGAPFKSRLDLLRGVIKNHSVKLAIYGPPKRWIKHPEFLSYYKGFLDPSKFYETLAESKFVFCSLREMSGRKHMNTKIWEAMTAGSIPICEPYPALNYQFGLVGKLALPNFRDSDDILEMIQTNREPTDLEKVRNFILGNYDYETSYSEMISSFYSVELNIKKKKNLVSHYCASSIIIGNKKIKPFIILPGHNVFQVQGSSIIRLGVLQSVKSIWAGEVSRTDFIFCQGKYSRINLINKYIYSSYLFLKKCKSIRIRFKKNR